jgi:lysozyme
MLDKLIDMVKRHEGLRLKLYADSCGKLTIGYGRCIEDIGISQQEADLLLMNDLTRSVNDLANNLPWLYEIDDIRRAALVDLCFQLGWRGLSKFQKTLEYAEKKYWDKAADELLDSIYAKQAPKRANEISEMLRTGQWQTGNQS